MEKTLNKLKKAAKLNAQGFFITELYVYCYVFFSKLSAQSRAGDDDDGYYNNNSRESEARDGVVNPHPCSHHQYVLIVEYKLFSFSTHLVINP